MRIQKNNRNNKFYIKGLILANIRTFEKDDINIRIIFSIVLYNRYFSQQNSNLIIIINKTNEIVKLHSS